jgi:branched-chain amino acid transport system permease protein
MGVSILVGFPAVRVRGMNLAIATLATAVALEELVFKWDWFTGGILGSKIERPTLWGIDFGVFDVGDAFPRRIFGVMAVIVAGAMYMAVANLRRSITGVRWLAVRSNERAAAAAGIDVARTKLTAFAAAGFIAGIGGTLIAYQQPILTVSSFAVLTSLVLLAITYLAGIASPNGAVVAGMLTVGGLLTVFLDQSSDTASEYQFAMNGLLLILAAVLYPSGLTGATRQLAARIRRSLNRTPTSESHQEPANAS